MPGWLHVPVMDVQVPAPPTPPRKRDNEAAECPTSANRDSDRDSEALGRKATRCEDGATARKSQGGGDKSSDDDAGAVPPRSQPRAPPMLPPLQVAQPQPPPPPPLLQRLQSAPVATDARVGRWVEVYWAGDSMWFLGHVDRQRTRSGRLQFKVAYTDGEAHHHVLQDEPFAGDGAPPEIGDCEPEPWRFFAGTPPSLDELRARQRELGEDELETDDSGSDSGKSDVSLDDYQNYGQFNDNLPQLSSSMLKAIVDELKPLARDADRAEYDKACASVDLDDRSEACLVKLIRRLMVFLRDDVVLGAVDAAKAKVADS